jgi:carbon monoxide dehydrogenase subunit G
MKLEQSFEVHAPVERVWSALLDVEHVAPCLPGAAVTGMNDDGSYAGTFLVKIGPTTASYNGKLVLEDVDEAAHTATIQADGTDRRGQGGARATIVSKIAAGDDGRTRVEVVTDYHITGRLARFGRGGMIEEISERLLKDFADRLQASLSTDGAAAEGGSPSPSPDPVVSAAPEPLDAGSLAAAAAWNRARSNQLTIAALVIALVVMIALRRRH